VARRVGFSDFKPEESFGGANFAPELMKLDSRIVGIRLDALKDHRSSATDALRRGRAFVHEVTSLHSALR
jgi:hypothetical protein